MWEVRQVFREEIESPGGGKENNKKVELTTEDLISNYKKAAWRSWKLTSTSGMLENLAMEADPVVRLGVAWNPQTQERILKILTNDEDPRVKRAAAVQLAGRETK